MDSVMRFARAGLALRSQRRGVMPFVTLWNFSGQSSKKSLKSESFKICVWSSATPFTDDVPTRQRFAMRTYRSPFSSMSDMRRSFLMSFG